MVAEVRSSVQQCPVPATPTGGYTASLRSTCCLPPFPLLLGTELSSARSSYWSNTYFTSVHKHPVTLGRPTENGSSWAAGKSAARDTMKERDPEREGLSKSSKAPACSHLCLRGLLGHKVIQ